MSIDISSMVLRADNESYYADWSIIKVQEIYGDTEVELRVEGQYDSEYLDLTVVFDILDDVNNSDILSSFYISSIVFNPDGPTAELVLTTKDIRSSDTFDTDYVERTRQGDVHTLGEVELAKIDYKSSPLIVGYCTSPTRLSIEV